MSNPEEPKKKPQATLAWNPEEVAGLQSGDVPDGTPADDPEEDPLVGQLIRDKWKVLKRLGAGSFGTVYKVQDVKGGWIEALKILGVDRLTGAEAENARKRFLREAQIMKRLGNESAHIVGLSTYEEDLEAGLIYFLMEFVEGKSLADALAAQGPFSVGRTIELGLQVCDALIAAHEGPDAVVHRDLKLENLMLTKDRSGEEVVKVLDFGIAKLTEKEADSRLTTVGTLGTPGYAAPEQLRAEAVDGRTDLFAFGVILYALLTGKDPWIGRPAGEPTSQIYELMVATDRGEVRPMEESGVEVPPAMQNVVMKLLRRNPDERFASARELRDALKRVAAGGASAEAGSLRVLTDQPGIVVQVRIGRRTVAEGPTPCVANGLMAGTYKVAVKDERYEPLETTLVLAPGAVEDLSLVTTPRSTGVAATVRRRAGPLVAAVLVALAAAGSVIVRPWGRTLDLAGLEARASGVSGAWLTREGIAGQLRVGPIPTPFQVPLADADKVVAVERLSSAGVEVDASREVLRLIGFAADAQARSRYYGHDGEDVRSFATRVQELDPGNAAARSLLLKVAERMAWDAEAAVADGSLEAARELARACLAVVPEQPRCGAVVEGG